MALESVVPSPMSAREATDVAIIGAGPIGLELAIRLRQAGIGYRQYDAGPIAATVTRFPPGLRFFSSPERIAIGGVPIPSVDQSKCTREEYLAYLRVVVRHFGLEVRTWEPVTRIERREGGFRLHSRDAAGAARVLDARRVVLATGGTARPRRLGLPGEEDAHVHHVLREPHLYFDRRVLVVGGRNSAVEAALRCRHVGSRVAFSYRRTEIPEDVKYWLRPEIRMLLRRGHVEPHLTTVPLAFKPGRTVLQPVDPEADFAPAGEPYEVRNDFVVLGTGWEADMSRFRELGVTLQGREQAPVFDEATMETDVPGVFVAGTAVAGTQSRYAVFLENCHGHATRIANALGGGGRDADEAAPVGAVELPES